MRISIKPIVFLSFKLKLKKWFSSKSIRSKINTIYIILIVAQILILMYAANYISTKAIIESTVKQSDESSRLVINNIENILNNNENYMNDLTVRINNYFIDDIDYGKNDYYKNMMFKKIFRNTLYVYPQIYAALLVLDDNLVFGSDNVSVKVNASNIIRSYRKQKPIGHNGSIWLGMGKNQYTTDPNNPNLLTLGKEIINIDSGEHIGLLEIMTSESTFSDIYKNVSIGRTGSYFICDNNGIVVSSRNKEELQRPISNEVLRKRVLDNTNKNQIININGEKTFITVFDFPKLNWKLIGTVPLTELTYQSRKISIAIVGIGAICILTAAVLSSLLSKNITKPIIKLINDIQKVQLDNLNIPLKVNAGEDIGLLVSNFNTMKQRISDLMTNIVKQQEKQKKYELKLLQAQIKPHFLYNTLQLIYSMIDMDKREQAKKATKALGDFYRIALSGGDEIITIEQEIKNIEDYLVIQKLRYDELFCYSIDVSDEIRNFKILKLTLQPIVENCIKHGMPNKFKNNTVAISITAKKEGDIIIFEIKDNGNGMNPEKIESLFNAQSIGNNESFGLRNLDDRIKLLYGYEYGIKIKSQYREYTKVSIIMPVIENIKDNFS